MKKYGIGFIWILFALLTLILQSEYPKDKIEFTIAFWAMIVIANIYFSKTDDK